MATMCRPNSMLVATLAALILCVNLVKVTPITAHAIEDSLPALVSEDEQLVAKGAIAKTTTTEASLASSKDASTTSGFSSPSAAAKSESVTEATTTEAPKLIPYETTKEDGKQVVLEVTSQQPVTSSTEGKLQETSTSQSPEQNQPPATEAAPAAPQSAAPSIIPAEPSKDLNVLFANKNDAENDLLAGSSKPTIISTDTKVVPASASPSNDPIDVPVETNKPSSDGSPLANDNRFHYAIGSTDKKEDSESEAEPSTTEAQTTTASTTLAPSSSTEKLAASVPEEPKKQAAAEPVAPAEDKLAGKKVETEEDKVKLAPEFPKDLAAKDSKKAEEPVQKEPEVITAQSSTQASPAFSPSETSTAISASPVAPTSTTTAKSTDKPALAANVPSVIAVALGTALSAAANPLGSGKEKPVVVATSSPAPPAATSTTKAPAASPSTTAAPAGSGSTTRKSSTDKWDRWNPTSSTQAPNRRRPILPSIRRRFRPYNRFSPFPWNNGGVDSYTPLGNEPSEFMPAEPRPHRPSTHELKPRRQSPSSPTTDSSVPKRGDDSEPASSSTSSPAAGAEEPAGDESTGGPSTTRKPSNKRRHHHHHMHHHTHNHNHEHHYHPGDISGAGSDEISPPSSRRRSNPNRHHHRHGANPSRGLSNNDEEKPAEPAAGSSESPSLGSGRFPIGNSEGTPFGMPSSGRLPRPLAPGFGLFNSAPSTGSGFDLLNPFTGWLDDVTRPVRPGIHQPSRGSGSRPGSRRPTVLSNGEYDERPSIGAGGSGLEGEHHGPGRGSIGRDDVYEPHHDHHHHHGRDCHEHDYDHDHEYHHRPHRDREPYRPGYEGNDYGNYGGGRRPTGGRPYIRSGGSNSESSNNSRESENSEASPSLYAPWKANSAPAPAPAQASASRNSPAELTPPRRVPSIFSPFDSLFSSLDDDLFSLRSSFVDSSPSRSDPTHTFDAVISSPKITMPTSDKNERVVANGPEAPVASIAQTATAAASATRDNKPKVDSPPVEGETNDSTRPSRSLAGIRGRN